APPSRHMIVLLPMCLIAVAHVFSKYSDVKKFVSILLFVFSWIIAALMFYDFRSLFTNLTWRNPDGFSPFWQRFKLEEFIPLLTASQPKILLILIWFIILIGLGFFLYPRQKKMNIEHS
ncbi:MAG TPA: hypothetical protein VLH08_02940, partial [Acidobacteriota bacterium]|nr:hypothetical protein [Acidobacteriota bacterium]